MATRRAVLLVPNYLLLQNIVQFPDLGLQEKSRPNCIAVSHPSRIQKICPLQSQNLRSENFNMSFDFDFSLAWHVVSALCVGCKWLHMRERRMWPLRIMRLLVISNTGAQREEVTAQSGDDN